MADSKLEGASGRKPPNAGKGRPKGSVNKTTALLKDAILIAATKAGGEGGLEGYLQLQAHENPGPFMSLLGKVLPIQMAGDLAMHHKVSGIEVQLVPVRQAEG